MTHFIPCNYVWGKNRLLILFNCAKPSKVPAERRRNVFNLGHQYPPRKTTAAWEAWDLKIKDGKIGNSINSNLLSGNKQFLLYCLQCGAHVDFTFHDFKFDWKKKAGTFRSMGVISSLTGYILMGIILLIKSSDSLIVIWRCSRPCGESVSVVHLKSASDYFLSIHHFVVWPQGINKQLSWIQVMANQSAFTAQSH